MIRKSILIYCFFVLCSSCDTLGYLDVKNNTKDKIYYVIYPEKEGSVKDTVVLEIPSDKTKGILFGFGHQWTDDNIKEYLSEVAKVEIVTEADTTVLSDKGELFNYFKAGRKGLFKKGIKIQVE